MWRFALLAPLLVAGSNASPQAEKNNATSVAVTSSSPQPSSSYIQSATSPVVITLSSSNSALSSTHSLSPSSFHSPSSASTLRLASSTPSSLSSSPQRPSSTKQPSSHDSTFIQTTVSRPISSTSRSRSSDSDHSTRWTTAASSSTGNVTTTRSCTGCVIQAYSPITTFFDEKDLNNRWTSLVVTETKLTEFITYMRNNATIDTIVTSVKTVNQTKTLFQGHDQTITHTTPVFTITPMPGTYLTVDAGPTYVIYQNLYGGLDMSMKKVDLDSGEVRDTCGVNPTKLKNWEPARTEDWSYFIQTHTGEIPKAAVTDAPIRLPSGILQYLQQNLAIRSQYRGSDIATCTLRPSETTTSTRPPSPFRPKPTVSAAPERPEPEFSHLPKPVPEASSLAAYPYPTIVTGTFLSTTYASTSTHVTVVGCLRAGCQGTPPPPAPTEDEPKYSNNINGAPPTPINPNVVQPTDTPSKPDNNVKPANQGPAGVPVTIGDSTYIVRPNQPTPNPDRPNEQNQAPPAVVIGYQTLTQGESTMINGVPVVVPSDGGGTRIIVGGTTVAINNEPTGAPVLTVGRNIVTANQQGQFVVGTETLKPGGPAITVDGSTLSLGPSGTIAIVNGVTQTLANVPFITAPPVITVGDRVISATLIGGTTQYVLGDQTLAPGNIVTVDGTTYSIPSADGRIVVNGVTSTLTPGQALGRQSITATIKDGTTAFIFAPGQTLTPGGVLTVSGTTFSMPASASGSVIVINGVTSTLAQGPITAAAVLTINGQTYSASIRDGTTEFVLGPNLTLRPGQVVTMSGTTYSLDKEGTALVINGKTSTIPKMPASNSATTTSVSARSSTTSGRDVGEFVWSGLGGGGGGGGGSTSKAGGTTVRLGGFDKWVENLVMGIAGWAIMVL